MILKLHKNTRDALRTFVESQIYNVSYLDFQLGGGRLKRLLQRSAMLLFPLTAYLGWLPFFLERDWFSSEFWRLAAIVSLPLFCLWSLWFVVLVHKLTRRPWDYRDFELSIDNP